MGRIAPNSSRHWFNNQCRVNSPEIRHITYLLAAIQVKCGKPVESKNNKHVKFTRTLTKTNSKDARFIFNVEKERLWFSCPTLCDWLAKNREINIRTWSLEIFVNASITQDKIKTTQSRTECNITVTFCSVWQDEPLFHQECLCRN